MFQIFLPLKIWDAVDKENEIDIEINNCKNTGSKKTLTYDLLLPNSTENFFNEK